MSLKTSPLSQGNLLGKIRDALLMAGWWKDRSCLYDSLSDGAVGGQEKKRKQELDMFAAVAVEDMFGDEPVCAPAAADAPKRGLLDNYDDSEGYYNFQVSTFSRQHNTPRDDFPPVCQGSGITITSRVFHWSESPPGHPTLDVKTYFLGTCYVVLYSISSAATTRAAAGVGSWRRGAHD